MKLLFFLPLMLACAVLYAEDTLSDTLTVYLPGNIPMVFQKISKGSFYMGSDEPENDTFWGTCNWTPICDKPRHRVTIAYDFYIGRYEVTQEQWIAIRDTNPVLKYNQSKEGLENRPVEHVSWADCYSFCKQLADSVLDQSYIWNFRLPSESEWEYACRAGTEKRYAFGDSLNFDTLRNDSIMLDEYCWWGGNNPGWIMPVGLKKPNAWGIYDMLGNVYEWCSDNWHWSYAGAPDDGTPWLEGDTSWKSIRGAWRGYSQAQKYTSYFRARHENYFDFRHDCCGFRVAMEVPVKKPSTSQLYNGTTNINKTHLPLVKVLQYGISFETDAPPRKLPVVGLYTVAGVCLGKITAKPTGIKNHYLASWHNLTGISANTSRVVIAIINHGKTSQSKTIEMIY